MLRSKNYDEKVRWKGMIKRYDDSWDQFIVTRNCVIDYEKQYCYVSDRGIDYKRQYDIIPYSWILKCLKMFGIA